jgi:hypothetical protein
LSALAEAFDRPATREPSYDQVNEGPIRNPEQYRTRIQQELEQAKAEEPVIDARFRRVPRKVWDEKDGDVRAFLEAEYAGHCQICGQTFPKRNGQPYFEGVYIISRTEAQWLDNAGNVLCLCPTCTAKFEYGAVQAEDIVDQLLALTTRLEGDGGEVIRILLCNHEVSIRFTERHLVRFQALLGGVEQ